MGQVQMNWAKRCGNMNGKCPEPMGHPWNCHEGPRDTFAPKPLCARHNGTGDLCMCVQAAGHEGACTIRGFDVRDGLFIQRPLGPTWNDVAQEPWPFQGVNREPAPPAIGPRVFTEAQVREAMVRVAGAFIAAESPAHSLDLYEDVASGRFR